MEKINYYIDILKRRQNYTDKLLPSHPVKCTFQGHGNEKINNIVQNKKIIEQAKSFNYLGINLCRKGDQENKITKLNEVTSPCNKKYIRREKGNIKEGNECIQNNICTYYEFR